MKILVGLVLFAAGVAHAQLRPANDAGMSMGHVHLTVADVDAQKKFWVEQFDAKPLDREGLPGVKLPGMLILFRKGGSSGGSEGTVIDHFGLKVRSLEEILKSCRAADVPVLQEFKGTEGFPNAYVMAPDNVKVELQQDTSIPVRAQSHHLHYYIKDPMALRTWYVETLSMAATKRGPFNTADVPGINLTFASIKEDTPRPPTKGRSLDHVGFEVKNLEALCKQLDAKGVKFDVPYRKVPNLGIAVAFLTDPAGVYIELTEGLTTF